MAGNLCKPLCGVWAWTVLAASSAPAALTSYQYLAQPASSNAGGGPVTVEIYLQESNAGTFSISTDGGLAGAAFEVLRDGTAFAKLTAITNDADNFPLYEPGNSTLSDALAKLATEGSLGGVSPDAAGLIHLGTLSIAAGEGVGSSTFTVRSAGLGNTVTSNATDLDAGGAGFTAATAGTFSVSVPEPANLSVLVLAGAGLARRRRGSSGLA